MMMQRSSLGWAVIAVSAALVFGGCEKEIKEARSAPADGKTSAAASVSAAAAATDSAAPAQPAGDPTVAAAHLGGASRQSADTQPAIATLMIVEDGAAPLATMFPPTKMRLKQSDGGRVVAELFSDLPVSALRKYDGNELYFEMQLQNADGGKLDNATWSFKSTSSGKVDSPNGIFLNGQQVHLQPDDVRVTFSRHQGDKQLYAHVQGRFRMYQPDTPDAAAPFVGVNGELAVEVVQKKS